jgi:uncharacterized protein (DUF1501 family)
MLTIWGGKQRFCDGITRRDFLKIGAFGAGLTLAEMLRLRCVAETTTKDRPKSAILIYLGGGPSHIDTYDLKPDAPAEFRGEFKPIATNVAGVHICEFFPRQAAMWDKLAVIRSVISKAGHEDDEVMTGYNQAVNRTAHHPSLGAVVSKLRGGVSAGVPAYVSLALPNGLEWDIPGNQSGYLGMAHRPFTPHGPGLQDLRLATGISAERLADRKALLASFDSMHRDLDASGAMEAMDAFTARAFDMVSSGAVRQALDLSREDPKVIQRYDAGPGEFMSRGGDKFLLARRLVEAGVGCVTVGFGGYDTHGSNFKVLKAKLPTIDRGLANLIQDLHDRGMDKDVVTVMWGEFGRTPLINKSDAGRDHWPQVMSALIAGGGLKMGQVIGSTSARAEYPKDRPYRVPQVLSTIYHALGIDPAQTLPNASGRPMHILDDREPVTELL